MRIFSSHLQRLRSETKNVKKIGKVRWTFHGQAEQPRVVHVAQAQAQMPEGTEKLAQAIVQVHLNQSLAIYEGEKVIGGDPDKIHSPVEFIVLEKWLERDHDGWKIKGKVME